MGNIRWMDPIYGFGPRLQHIDTDQHPEMQLKAFFKAINPLGIIKERGREKREKEWWYDISIWSTRALSDGSPTVPIGSDLNMEMACSQTVWL